MNANLDQTVDYSTTRHDRHDGEAGPEKNRPAKDSDSDTDFQPGGEPEAAVESAAEEDDVVLVNHELKNLEPEKPAPTAILPQQPAGKPRLFYILD